MTVLVQVAKSLLPGWLPMHTSGGRLEAEACANE